MAVSSSTAVGGYSCDLFLRSVSDELKCVLCKQVARDPNITSCCGEEFCKLCITQVIDDNKACPSCEEAEFTTLANKRDHRKILALEVRCSMKDRGCDWTGTLEKIDAHLDVNFDNCQYVNVNCPNKCEQPVQKRHLPTHLANECAKRDFFCQYCNFTATYEVVCNTHWPQCPFYPVPCPNGCEIMAIERGDLDAHLMLCSLEVVECDFSYAGCNVKLVREEMEKHMEENLQRHTLMINKALQERIEEKERKIEQLEVRLEEKEGQIREQIQEREQLRKEKDEQIEQLRDENDRQIQELRDEHSKKVHELQKTTQDHEQRFQGLRATVERIEEELKGHVRDYRNYRFGDAQFTMTGYHMWRRKWESPKFYTHPGGYAFTVCVFPGDCWYHRGKGMHVSVDIEGAVSENDDHLERPALYTITLQLLNQHRDQDHITVTRHCEWYEPGFTIAYDPQKIIRHNDLTWNSEKQTQYLKNDSLHFRITGIEPGRR